MQTKNNDANIEHAVSKTEEEIVEVHDNKSVKRSVKQVEKELENAKVVNSEADKEIEEDLLIQQKKSAESEIKTLPFRCNKCDDIRNFELSVKDAKKEVIPHSSLDKEVGCIGSYVYNPPKSLKYNIQFKVRCTYCNDDRKNNDLRTLDFKADTDEEFVEKYTQIRKWNYTHKDCGKGKVYYSIDDSSELEKTGKEIFENKKKEKEEEKHKIPDNFLLKTAEDLQKVAPVYYDTHKMFWMWKENKWVWIDEIDIFNALKNKLSFLEFFNKNWRAATVDAIKMSGRERIVKAVPKTWISTLSGVYDVETCKIFPATPEYFFAAPIPHKIGNDTDTPIIDKLFNSWVAAEDVISLYEIASYCLIDDYPIHRIFTTYGGGGNGKGQYVTKFLPKLVGEENKTAADFKKLLTSRFEAVNLHRKKICIIDETIETITNTDILKGLSGDGWISVEYKGVTPFSINNTCKIIILTNNVPETKDKTDSWYRRSFLIEFPNQFEEGKSIVSTIPDIEYENFLNKSLKILSDLMIRGKFTADKPLAEKRTIYEQVSNRVKQFIDEKCESAPVETPAWMLLDEFNNYFAIEKKCRTMTKKSFNEALKEEGIDVFKDKHGHQIIAYGIRCKTKKNFDENSILESDKFNYETQCKECGLKQKFLNCTESELKLQIHETVTHGKDCNGERVIVEQVKI